MTEALGGWSQAGSLLLAFVLGAALTASLVMALQGRLQRPALDEAKRLRKTLRMTQVQLEQARKNAEALSEEVQGWRQRSNQFQQARSQRVAVDAPLAPAEIAPAEAEVDVISALLSDDSHLRRRRVGSKKGEGDKPGFADTQILPGYAH